MNMPFVNPILVCDAERTICSQIRNCSGIKIQTFQDALKQYAKRKDEDLRKQMRYAQMLHDEKLRACLRIKKKRREQRAIAGNKVLFTTVPI